MAQILELDLRIGTQDIGPYWMAFEQQLGIVAFEDSEDAVVERLRKAIDFAMDNVGREHLHKYLDDHGVKYSYREQPPDRVVNISRDPEAVLANVG